MSATRLHDTHLYYKTFNLHNVLLSFLLFTINIINKSTLTFFGEEKVKFFLNHMYQDLYSCIIQSKQLLLTILYSKTQLHWNFVIYTGYSPVCYQFFHWYYYHYYTPLEFFTSVSADGLLLEFE